MSRRTRRPVVRPGSTVKRMQANAKVRGDIADEKTKHNAKVIDIADRWREALLLNDPALRVARLDRLSHQRVEEDRRHKAALDKLQAKIKL